MSLWVGLTIFLGVETGWRIVDPSETRALAETAFREQDVQAAKYQMHDSIAEEAVSNVPRREVLLVIWWLRSKAMQVRAHKGKRTAVCGDPDPTHCRL